MPATILSAQRSNVLVNGQTLEGLQEITFQTARPHQDIAAIGAPDRVGVVFGSTSVVGSLRVRSVSPVLEGLLANPAPFQIMAALNTGLASEERVIPVTLQEVYLHGKNLGLGAGGVVETTYHFTATRVTTEAAA